jgi:hypothetical protein
MIWFRKVLARGAFPGLYQKKCWSPALPLRGEATEDLDTPASSRKEAAEFLRSKTASELWEIGSPRGQQIHHDEHASRGHDPMRFQKRPLRVRQIAQNEDEQRGIYGVFREG